MEIESKYLTQSNFFTRSVLRLSREIQKDIIYLIQDKTDFYGDVKDSITISFNDYLNYKGIIKNNAYSFKEFKSFTDDIKSMGGAFYNNVNSRFVSFNLIDNVQIDESNAESLIIDLAKFGKIFFFKKALEDYITEVTPQGKLIKYTGHTTIDNKAAFNLKGKQRKKFFEIISQFKSKGFCKISFKELKMYLGYVEFLDKETQKPIERNEQLKLLFIPSDKYEMIDTCPRYSIFERDFLKPAIDAINKDGGKDINNLKISNKIKTGRSITHLEFTFNALGANLNQDEINCLEFFTGLGLDEEQVKYLLKRVGYKEMYGRYMHNVEPKIIGEEKTPKYYERNSGKEIKNLAGYFYKVLFKELH